MTTENKKNGCSDSSNKNTATQSKKVFGTREWSTKSASICLGCSNACKYCYATAGLIRMGMKSPKTRSIEEIRLKEVERSRKKVEGATMFPTTHDITPSNLKYCIQVLRKLLESGNDVLIVSKPHFEVIKKICAEFEDYKKQILFRFTIGSGNQKVLSFWEPDAPSFQERFKSLKYAFGKGFQTSVSCEPCIDPNIRPLISKLLPYVTDAIWIGVPNLLVLRLSLNGYKDEDTVKKARALQAELNEGWAKQLYREFKHNRHIKWKESLKKVLGIDIPYQAGLDM